MLFLEAVMFFTPHHAMCQAAESQQRKTVLLLHSYHQGLSWTDGITEEIMVRLKGRISEISVEYIDAKRHSYEMIAPSVAQYLRDKYRNQQPDIIIAADNRAMSLLQDNKDLFPQARIVFCGINNYHSDMVAEFAGRITGVVEETDPSGTLDIIQMLQPSVRRIAVITGTDSTAMEMLDQMKRELPSHPLYSKLEWWHGLSTDDLISRLGMMKKDDAVLLVLFNRDGKGNYYSYEDSARIIVNGTHSPVYGLWDFYLNTGVVGGRMASSRDQGREAANLTLQITNSVLPDLPPIIETSPNATILDYGELLRHGLLDRPLPVEARIVNRPEGLYERYGGYLWFAAVMFLVQTILLALLAVSMVRRREAAKSLQTAYSEVKEVNVLLESVLNGIPDVIGIQDTARNIIRYNDAGYRFLGVGHDEAKGKKCYQLVGLSAPCDVCATEKALHTGQPAFVEKYVDTMGIWLEARAYPIMDESGHPVKIIEHLRDVSERKDAEEAIRKSEERLRITLGSIGDGVIATDAMGLIERMNAVAVALTGWPEEDAVGVPLTDVFKIVNEDTREPVENPVNKVLREGKIVGLANHTVLLARNGRECPIADSGAPIRDADNEIVGVVLVFRDQTREREYENALRQSNEDLELRVRERTAALEESTQRLRFEMEERKRAEAMVIHAERLSAVGTLAGGVAHEFNNINVAVLGFAELGAAMTDLPEHARDYFERIQKAGKRAGQITQKLLTFTSPSTGDKSAGILSDIVEETIGLVRHEFTSTGVRIIERLQGTPMSRMDHAMVGQVVLNLLINAHHAMAGRDRKILTVSCGTHEGSLYLRVEDTGCGMTEETRKQIFTPFFSTKGEHAQGDTPQRSLRGTGLGLSICSTIIDNHGGTIECESTPGLGTVFTVKFPVQNPPSDTSGSERAIETKVDCQITGRLLVLDDEDDICDLIKHLFRHDKLHVHCLKDGHEAMRLCASGKIDAILLDLQMPSMTGIEFARMLRANHAILQPEIIVMSGRAMAVTESEVAELDIFRVVNKPFEAASIRRDVMDAISKRK